MNQTVPPRSQPFLEALLTLLFVGLLVFGGTGRALAHAALIEVVPADGAMLAAAPRNFSITFNEPTSPLVLKLIAPDGTSTVLDRYTLKDATLEIEAPKELGPGTHVLSWRVVSEDGHPVGGSSVFSIGAPSPGGLVAPQEATDWPLRAAIWAARVLVYIGLFTGAGGSFFLSLIGGSSSALRRLLAGAMLAGLAAAVLSVGLQGLDALDLPLASLAAGGAWKTGFSTSYGWTALLAAISMLAGLGALAFRGLAGKLLASIALLGAGLALAASGHASAAPPQEWTRPAVFLHALGIAFWAGALLPLATALTRRSPEAPQVLRRFSRLIPLALLPLVAAGLLLAVVQLQSLDALWTTDYGRVLLAKLILLAGLFALAAWNRFRLTKPAEAGDAAATARLIRSIRIEIALVLAVLAVAALWRFTPPPRALAEAAATPAALHIHTEKAMADVTITPGHAGPVTVAITILTGDFGPLDTKELTLVLSNPTAGIEPIRRAAKKGSDAIWRVDGLTIPVPGRWHVRLDILVSDFDMAQIEDEVDIRP